MVFHGSLCNSKFPQVSRTLLSIPTVVVLMVSARPLIFKFFSPFKNPLVTLPKPLITIGIIVTFMFQFFQFPSKVLVLILLLIFFQFYCGQPGQHNSADYLFFFFGCCWWLLPGLVFWLWLSDLFGYQNPIGAHVCHSSRQLLYCAYTICSYGQISVFGRIPSQSPCPLSRV